MQYSLPRDAFEILVETFKSKEKAEKFAKAIEGIVNFVKNKSQEEIVQKKEHIKIELKEILITEDAAKENEKKRLEMEKAKEEEQKLKDQEEKRIRDNELKLKQEQLRLQYLETQRVREEKSYYSSKRCRFSPKKEAPSVFRQEKLISMGVVLLKRREISNITSSY